MVCPSWCGSVGWCIVSYTERSWVWFWVRVHIQITGSIPGWNVCQRVYGSIFTWMPNQTDHIQNWTPNLPPGIMYSLHSPPNPQILVNENFNFQLLRPKNLWRYLTILPPTPTSNLSDLSYRSVKIYLGIYSFLLPSLPHLSHHLMPGLLQILSVSTIQSVFNTEWSFKDISQMCHSFSQNSPVVPPLIQNKSQSLYKDLQSSTWSSPVTS